MSGHESYPPPGSPPPPPPGWQPPPAQPPGWPQQPPAPGWAAPYPAPPGHWPPPPGMLGAAHKPGAIPLRPLGLGDLYDGAFKVIRYNPKVTVGAPVLVAAVALVVPVLISLVLTWGAGFTIDLESSDTDVSTGDVLALVAIVGSFVLGLLAQTIGMLLVTGMIAHVVLAAAEGRRLALGEAWAATHGKRWRILLLALLLGVAWLVALAAYVGLWLLVTLLTESTPVLVVFGVVSGLAFVVLAVVAYVRFTYLAVSVLALEPVGILGALGRAARLTRGAFWRTFGIGLLTAVIAQVGSAVLTCPLGIAGGVLTIAVPTEYQLVANILLQAVTTVVSAALVTPFMTTVTTLQYVDLRMRKEAFDVELLTRAGIVER